MRTPSALSNPPICHLSSLLSDRLPCNLGRLVRLIPDDPEHDDSEKAAIKIFFNHRLSKDKDEAKKEWLQIVENDHELWNNITTAKKELIRSFLNMINFEILKRLRPSSTFEFSSASIGNLFLTGYVSSVYNKCSSAFMFSKSFLFFSMGLDAGATICTNTLTQSSSYLNIIHICLLCLTIKLIIS